MKQIEIFKENIKFVQWGELYAGCKMKWITPSDVLDFCNERCIDNVSEEDYIDLYFALDDSLYAFYTKLKEYIIKEGCKHIVKNEDNMVDFGFTYIPTVYFRIWELEFLLQIRNKSLSPEEKIEEVTFLFDVMNYPNRWIPFYLYSTDPPFRFIPITETYPKFLSYIQEEIRFFQNFSKIDIKEKSDIYFQSWGEVYLGLKQKWISPVDVLKLSAEYQIRSGNMERHLLLYLALEESLFKFYNQIKIFIEEDGDPRIVKNEDELNDDLNYIPQPYWGIWERYFLLKIKNNTNSISEKFDQIFSLRVPFNYPTEWDFFLYERPQADGSHLCEQERYQIFLDYISTKFG
jgi:hypothetical protein